MKCPFCGLDNTRVIDSRPADDNSSIRRRRLCDECGKRFTTYERVEIMPLTVIIHRADILTYFSGQRKTQSCDRAFLCPVFIISAPSARKA